MCLTQHYTIILHIHIIPAIRIVLRHEDCVRIGSPVWKIQRVFLPPTPRSIQPKKQREPLRCITPSSRRKKKEERDVSYGHMSGSSSHKPYLASYTYPEDCVSIVLEPSLSPPETSNCRSMVIVTSYHGYLLKDCFHSDVNLIRIRLDTELLNYSHITHHHHHHLRSHLAWRCHYSWNYPCY